MGAEWLLNDNRYYTCLYNNTELGATTILT